MTKVFRKGGFIVVEQGTNKMNVPLRNFDFNFTAADTVKLKDNASQTRELSDTLANIQDESGTPVGATKELVRDYLSSLTDAF